MQNSSYILKYNSKSDSYQQDNIIYNSADYSGAVYLDDNSNSGTCDCFFQVLALYNN